MKATASHPYPLYYCPKDPGPIACRAIADPDSPFKPIKFCGVRDCHIHPKQLRLFPSPGETEE